MKVQTAGKNIGHPAEAQKPRKIQGRHSLGLSALCPGFGGKGLILEVDSTANMLRGSAKAEQL